MTRFKTLLLIFSIFLFALPAWGVGDDIEQLCDWYGDGSNQFGVNCICSEPLTVDDGPQSASFNPSGSTSGCGSLGPLSGSPTADFVTGASKGLALTGNAGYVFNAISGTWHMFANNNTVTNNTVCSRYYMLYDSAWACNGDCNMKGPRYSGCSDGSCPGMQSSISTNNDTGNYLNYVFGAFDGADTGRCDRSGGAGCTGQGRVSRGGDDFRFEEEMQGSWVRYEVCFDHNVSEADYDAVGWDATLGAWPGTNRLYFRAQMVGITGAATGKVGTYGPAYGPNATTFVTTGSTNKIWDTGLGNKGPPDYSHTRGDSWLSHVMVAETAADPTFWIGKALEVEPGPTATPTVTPAPTVSPTVSPTQAGPTPTATPILTPTVSPTASPTPTGPTPTSTPIPTPTATPISDADGDGVENSADNCSDASNPQQDDTDTDDCGNICDADYDDSGTVGFPDFGEFIGAWASGSEEFCHHEPGGNAISAGCEVGWTNWGLFIGMFGSNPGSSGTTSGTTACP